MEDNGAKMPKKQHALSNEADEGEDDDEDKDRISDLPDAILVHILSFLMMDVAVKTGILSKRWDRLWTQVRRLNYEGPATDDDNIQEEDSFIQFVNHTMSLHEPTTIEEFHLYFSLSKTVFEEETDGEEEDERVNMLVAEVDKWVHFAVQRKARNVVIDLDPNVGDTCASDAVYKLPCYFYTNDFSKSLTLDYCIMEQDRTVLWKSLRTLLLEHIQLSDKMIEDILVGCPLLNVLKLGNCLDLENLNITSRKLKHLVLDISSGSKLKINAPYVRSLTITGDIADYEFMNVGSVVDYRVYHKSEAFHDSHIKTLRRLLYSVNPTISLTFTSESLQVLSMMEVKDQHLSSLNCHTLRLWTFLSKWDLPGIVALLRATPRLQTLIVRLNHYARDNIVHLDKECLGKHDYDEANYWMSLVPFPTYMTVRTVQIVGFSGGPVEKALVEFFLKAAYLLQTVVIVCKKEDDPLDDSPLGFKEMMKFSQKLLSFPRASRDAVVLFS